MREVKPVADNAVAPPKIMAGSARLDRFGSAAEDIHRLALAKLGSSPAARVSVYQALEKLVKLMASASPGKRLQMAESLERVKDEVKVGKLSATWLTKGFLGVAQSFFPEQVYDSGLAEI